MTVPAQPLSAAPRTATGPVVLPGALVFGTVSWTVVGVAEDTALDTDDVPDAQNINGWATFTAMPDKIVKGSPDAVTVLPRPVRYAIAAGRLVDAEGRTAVKLVGNDSPGTTPQGWSYHVDWELDDGFSFGGFDFYLAGGDALDLSDVQPLLEPATGTLYVQGPQGDPGPQGIQGIQGIQGVKGDPGDLTAVVSNNAASGTINPISAGNLPSTRAYTLAGNTTIGAPGTSPAATVSGTITLVIKQAATGGPYTVTWPAVLEWSGDAAAPIMPTVANAELIVHLFWTGTAWRGMVGGVFYP